MRLILFILIFMPMASPCLADVITTTSTEHYPVQGATKNEILRDMKRQSPRVNGNRFSVAHQQSEVRYEYQYQKRNGLCSITEVTIHLHITYRYPRLAQTPKDKTAKWWDTFYKNLEKHERIHGDIARRAAARMDKKLNAIGDIDCYNVDGILKVKGRKMIERLNDEQAKYDKLTENGLKQERYKGH